MANLIFPRRRFIQPAGPVEVDWKHPLARGLVFFQVANRPGAPELVGGQMPTILSGTTWSVGQNGGGFNSTSSANHGWGTQRSPLLAASIGTEHTIAASIDIAGLASNAKIVCVPYHALSWTSPWISMTLARKGSTSRVAIEVVNSAATTSTSADFPDGTYAVGTNRNYIATRSGTAASLLLNGVRHDPVDNALPSTAVVFGTNGTVATMNRSRSTPGEGTTGKLYYAAIWNRALTESEQEAFQDDPYQLLRPVSSALFYSFDDYTEIVTYSGQSSVSVPAFVSTGTGAAAPPTYSGVSESSIPAFTSVGIGAFVPPALSGESESLVPAFVTTGTGTVVAPKTRLYLSSTGSVPISVAYNAIWDQTGQAVVRPMSTTKGSSPITLVSDTETSTGNAWDVLLGQFVSPPLQAQTISGTVLGIVRAYESSTDANTKAQFAARVVSGDGGTVRGTLVSPSTSTGLFNEWVVSADGSGGRTARFPAGSSGTTVTSVTAQAGDRIVVELGARLINTSATPYTVGLRFGEDAPDAPTSELGTTDAAGWVEFNTLIAFQEEGTVGSSSSVLQALETTATGSRAIPARTGSSATILEAIEHVASGVSGADFSSEFSQEFLRVSLPPNLASSNPTLSAFDHEASGSRTIPARVGSSAAQVSAFLADASGNRDIPLRVGSSATHVAAFDANASGDRTVPLRSGVSHVALGTVGTSSTGVRAIPDRTGDSHVTIGTLETDSSGSRTIPDRTGTSATSLLPFGHAALGARGLGGLDGTSVSRLSSLVHQASGSRSVPDRVATSASLVPTFDHDASGERQVPEISGSSSVSLSPAKGTATGTRAIPERTGTSASSIVHLSSSAAGTRGIPVRSGASNSNVRPLRTSTTATRTVPPISGSSTATVPSVKSAAVGVLLVPPRYGDSAARLPAIKSTGTGTYRPGTVLGTSSLVLVPANTTSVGSRTVPDRVGISPSKLKAFKHSSRDPQQYPHYAGFSASRLRKFTTRTSARHASPMAADLSAIVDLTGSVVYEVELTGTVDPDISFIGSVRIAS